MKRKLAFSTLGCPDLSFEQIVSSAAAFGFDAIEIRGCLDVTETEKLSFFLPENQIATDELLKKNRISICGIGTSCNFHTAELREKAAAESRRALDIAKQMDIPQIRVFGNSLPEEGRDETIISVADGIADACEYAASIGGRTAVLLEIHGDFNTVEVLSPLTEQLKKYDNFGFIFDVQHVFLGENENWRALFELVRPFIRHIHFKDYVITDGVLTPCLMGRGVVPLSEMAEAFDDTGYDGFYSFEWEKRWHTEIENPEIAFPDFIDFMKKL